MWCAEEELVLSFNDLNLDANLLRALEDCGFTSPTEVQEKAIPIALTGKDLMTSAQTGTGKTAAFMLPTLQRLLNNPAPKGRGPRALVLTPTRELATQVTDMVRDLARHTRMRYGTIVGGVSYIPQFKLLKAPLDILVATPGRLIDHMERGGIDFSRLEVLILDEADRMLDMGFQDAVEAIASATPENRQTLLFSATLEGEVLRVAKRHLKDPERVQLAAVTQAHESIEQWMHQATGLKHKKEVLAELLIDPTVTQAVIFTATKRRAQELSEELADLGHATAPLHGNMTQAARRRTVDQLRRGRVRILVATDVAARGLDVPGISHVINFELPTVPEDYIHRIGRTGRAGATGVAISIVGRKEWHRMNDIERLTGRRVEQRKAPRGVPGEGAPLTAAPYRADDREQRRDDRRPAERGDRYGNRSEGRDGNAPRGDRPFQDRDSRNTQGREGRDRPFQDRGSRNTQGREGRELRTGHTPLRGGHTEHNLFVSNLPWDTSDAELVEVFSPYGQVAAATVAMDRESGRSRGFGFVSMSSGESVERAIDDLDGATLAGRPLLVKKAVPKAEHQKKNGFRAHGEGDAHRRGRSGSGFPRKSNDNRGGDNRRGGHSGWRG